MSAGSVCFAQNNFLLCRYISNARSSTSAKARMVRVHAMKANAIPLPRVTVVSDPGEIDSQHILWLQSKCYRTGPYSLSSSEVTKALQKSCSVIAAYCRADALPEGIIRDFPDRIKVGKESGSNEEWQLRRAAKRQKVLIGLTHASSDGVFVGTVDHVMVLPELQNQGLGRRLMNKACSQLLRRDVTDIGTLVPPEQSHFFHKCGFSLDKYNSVAMRLRDDAVIERDALRPHDSTVDRLEHDKKLMLAATKPRMIGLLQAHTILDL